jgi:hypothetical protein
MQSFYASVMAFISEATTIVQAVEKGTFYGTRLLSAFPSLQQQQEFTAAAWHGSGEAFLLFTLIKMSGSSLLF